MIETLIILVLVLLIAQLLMSFVPGLDRRIVAIVILLIVLIYFFGYDGHARFWHRR